MVQTISLLGSTGSIGRQTLDVCREQGIRVAALTARSSLDLLEEQARAFRPRLVAVTDLAPYRLAASITSSPAQTSVSLLAKATRLPASIAAMVGHSADGGEDHHRLRYPDEQGT